MKNLAQENIKLKEKIKTLQQTIKEQNKIIAEYENNWTLQLFDALDAIINEYSLLLSPYEIKIKASHQNKSEEYVIKTSNIICVFSVGRVKNILLKESVIEKGHNERKTNLISTDSDWETIIQKLDPSKFYLCEANKSIWVNVKFYNFEMGKIITESERDVEGLNYLRIEIKKKHKENFIVMKEFNKHIISLHKLHVDYKLKNGVSL